MRIFVTGASGFIGSAVVPELIAAGHQVLGLARSDASARVIEALGAEVHRGDLNDFASVQAGAAESEGTIHLGFIHDFSNFEASLRTDRAVIDALGEALAGTQRPLVVAGGTLALAPGQLATEDMAFDAQVHGRHENAIAALDTAKRGVRASLMRFSPTVHGEGDHLGFISMLVKIAREKQVSGYIGDGSNRWNAVHRLDAARLVRLGVERARAGSILHAVADEGVTTRTIAEIIGKKLQIPVSSIAPPDAAGHFGWFARLFAMDQPASSAITRRQMDWNPTHASLVEDLESGHYFR
jgi:nucleoside-diphosphate-sugar epimerase